MAPTPHPSRLTSAGAATAARAKLEVDTHRELLRAYNSFARAVMAEAVQALTSPVIVAAGIPGMKQRGDYDPFAYTNIRAHWYATIRELAQRRNDLFPADVAEIILDSSLPGDLFEQVSDVLTRSRADEWTTHRTKRELSALLIPKNGGADRAPAASREGRDYRAAVRRWARTAATANFSRRQLYDLADLGATHKRWVAHHDERTRATHRHADGQVAAMGGEFTVGGYGLQFPGDPTAPPSETENCRCIIIGADEPPRATSANPRAVTAGGATLAPMTIARLTTYSSTAAEPLPTDAPPEGGADQPQLPLEWEGVIGMEGKLTGDGRVINVEALSWSTPIPLRYVASDVGAHDGAVVVGRILTIERQDDGRVWATGDFDGESASGIEAARHVFKNLTNGISMDLDDVSFEVRLRSEIVVNDDEAFGADTLPNADEEVSVTTAARIRAATIVAIPAFAEAQIHSVTGDGDRDGSEFNWVDDAGGLPPYIKRISKHLQAKGMSQSHAIATAINAAKKMCSTGDLNFPGAQQVNPGSKAEACAAVAHWEEMKASHAGDTDAFTAELATFAYNPDQARVPAGNGRLSGRWVDMPGGVGKMFRELADLQGPDDPQASRLKQAASLLENIDDVREPEARGAVEQAKSTLDDLSFTMSTEQALQRDMSTSLGNYLEVKDWTGVDLLEVGEDDAVIRGDVPDVNPDLLDAEAGVPQTSKGLADRVARPVSADLAREFAGGSAEAHLEQGPDGELRFTPERQELHRQLVDMVMHEFNPEDDSYNLDQPLTRSDRPTYQMLGGGPAAGKSTIMADYPQLTGGAAVVNADLFKLGLPEYAEQPAVKAAGFTHEESSYLSKLAVSEAMSRGYNVTLDGTGNSSLGSLQSKIDQAREAGYSVEGFYVTIDTDTAVERAMSRGERTGRVVNETVVRGTHARVSAVVPDIVKSLDAFVLYDTAFTPPKKIGERGPDGQIKVLDEATYAAFLAKANEQYGARRWTFATEGDQIDAHELASMFAEIVNGVAKEESRFSGRAGFDSLWDTMVEQVAANPDAEWDIPNEVPDVNGYTDAQPAAVTAGAFVRRPAEWFADPELTEPTALVVTEDGRVYGHLAAWGTCHTGHAQQCVTPPTSQTDYAYFRTGVVATTGGDVSVGQITLDTFHAESDFSAMKARAHYEHTGAAVADVAVGEDEYGIWVAGALRGNLPDDVRDSLRAAPLSGDWRNVGGNLELVAALAVNVPGFPIPRPKGLVAGGFMESLVASHIVTRTGQEPDEALSPMGATPIRGLDARDAAVLSALVAKQQRTREARTLASRMNVVVASALAGRVAAAAKRKGR